MGIGSGAPVDESGEIAAIKKLHELKRPSYCIFDVGANQGQFVSLISSYFRQHENYQVHCFEPSVYTFRILSQKLACNNHVILNNRGLGEKNGEFELFYDKPGSGKSSLIKRKLDHFNIEFNLSEKVTIDTVDNYCQDNNIGRIDLLKIDTEGHEMDVLNGSQKMFQSNSIQMVSFEFGGCAIDARKYFQDFYYFFNSKKFSLYRITPSGYLYPIPNYQEVYEQFRTTNFLAINDRG
jgi:FkbM family methyltransferase